MSVNSMSLTKNLKRLTDSPLLKTVITWDKAERIRRNKEIWDDKGSIVHRLPLHYQQWYWKNLVLADRAPVHYRIPECGVSWDPKKKVEIRHENIPIIGYKFLEQDLGLLGGERVVKGYREGKPLTKKKILPRRWVPRLYFPEIRYTILYSEVLDKYMRLFTTERAKRLIDKHFGLDYYLLETPDIDIDSMIGMKLKRNILMKLANEDYYPEAPERHDYIKRKYAKFVIPAEEAEWRCMELNEAVRYFQDLEDNNPPEPYKYRLEKELVEQLQPRIAAGEEVEDQGDLYPHHSKKEGVFDKFLERLRG